MQDAFAKLMLGPSASDDEAQALRLMENEEAKDEESFDEIQANAKVPVDSAGFYPRVPGSVLHQRVAGADLLAD